VVYLPKEKVLISGDLLTNGIPFMRDGYPSQWINALESLQTLDWTQAIPGHGGVQQGKGQLEKLTAFMRDLVAAVKSAIAKGMTLEDAKKSIDLSKHAPNFPGFAQSSQSAIDRAWAELSGKIPD
jgi:glyoxylase-like metal-dependent hydrolase (beta-lactamase superfamily II)